MPGDAFIDSEEGARLQKAASDLLESMKAPICLCVHMKDRVDASECPLHGATLRDMELKERRVQEALQKLRFEAQRPLAPTLDQIQDMLNRRNAAVWPQCEEWDLRDWVIAVANEAGEILGDVKKWRRGDLTQDEVATKVAKEISDVMAYCILTLSFLRFRAGWAFMAKFDEVSRREGYVDQDKSGPQLDWRPLTCPEEAPLNMEPCCILRGSDRDSLEALSFMQSQIKRRWQKDGRDGDQDKLRTVAQVIDSFHAFQQQPKMKSE